MERARPPPAHAGPQPRGATQKATAQLYREAFAAFDQNAEPPTSGAVARDTLRVIDAAYRSARTGERVDLASTATLPSSRASGDGVEAVPEGQPPSPAS